LESTQESVARPLRGPLRKRESHLWSRDPDDFYVEPEWCSQRLFEVERFERDVWDPACGLCRIVQSASDAGLMAAGSDKVKRHPAALIADFMDEDWAPGPYGDEGPAHIVCNPPFGLCDPSSDHPGFVELALERASGKVAMLLPANWVQGDRRSRWLETTPLYRVYYLSPRPSMPPGAVIEAGLRPGNGTTDYAWLIWLKGFSGPWTGHWLRRDA
jgi:hypothetical protein